MVTFLRSRFSRRIHSLLFLSAVAVTLLAAQGCTPDADTDPAAQPIPTSQQAK